MSEAVLRLAGIHRTFKQGNARLEILRGVDLTIGKGEVVALLGPSGSGKSTLLQIAGLLESPDAGDVYLNGQACGRLGDGARTGLRRQIIGFVYQFHHLLAEFSAEENVMIPNVISGVSKQAARIKAQELLGRFGLSERLGHRPARLSGGEQQRVAIARALANDPDVLIADEPTGNLDHKTADVVFDELVGHTRERALSALIATHNIELARRMDRIVLLQDGLLQAFEG